MKRLYYRLTAYWPRPLPTSPREFKHLLHVLHHYYDVPREPQALAVIAGVICSTQPTQVTKAWGHIANAAKRLKINKLANDLKLEAIAALESRLAELAKTQSESEQAKTTVSPITEGGSETGP